MPFEQHLDKKLDNFLKKSPRPFMQGCVYARGNTVFFEKGTPTVVTSPIFEIGSIGKTLTAILLAMLVMEKKVRLDDTGSRFCPRYTGCPPSTLPIIFPLPGDYPF